MSATSNEGEATERMQTSRRFFAPGGGTKWGGGDVQVRNGRLRQECLHYGADDYG